MSINIDDVTNDNLATLTKRSLYLEQENAVLIERVRQLEISLAAEREACARIAESKIEGIGNPDIDGTAKSIATLIRGRGET